MTALLLALILQQAAPSRAVVLEATIDKVKIGEVIYSKNVLSNKRIERVTIFAVDEEDKEKYTIRERRLFDSTGKPLLIDRSYQEDGEVLSISVAFHDNIADVTFSKGEDKQTSSIALLEEDASIKAVSETWFVSKTPTEGESAEFWEYDIDSSNWVKRVIKYHGKTDLKVGDEILKVHRMTVGDQINIYVDDKGLPYKFLDKSVKGDFLLMRATKEGGR